MNHVVVIDYGMGNLHSVTKAAQHVGERLKLTVTADEKAIRNADRLIFPGVGAMRDCMAEIRRLGIDDMLRETVGKKPVLAICVGMQALLDRSDENDGVDCIGLVPGRVRRFQNDQRDESGEPLKVPHMGWNTVRQTRAHPLWRGIPDNSRFYFVHSYYAEPADQSVVVGETDYPAPFTSALHGPKLFGVQFHPEKSQDWGLRLIANFLTWDGND